MSTFFWGGDAACLGPRGPGLKHWLAHQEAAAAAQAAQFPPLPWDAQPSADMTTIPAVDFPKPDTI